MRTIVLSGLLGIALLAVPVGCGGGGGGGGGTRALYSQNAYIKASTSRAGSQFGFMVAMSGDTMVVGAPGDSSGAVGVNGDESDESAPESGAAYVYVRSGGRWVQQAYLKASNSEAGDGFGGAVAISGDTIVVGAEAEASAVPGDETDNSLPGSGAAYVFVRRDGLWTQQAYLKASNPGVYDQFGFAVAISGDTIVVGAPCESSAATGVDGDQADDSADCAGAAYVYVRAGATWYSDAYLKASNTDGDDGFGFAVAISEDRIVVGAPDEASASKGIDGDGADDSAVSSGAAYVFRRDAVSWFEEAYLKASNTDESDQFGFSVAIWRGMVVVGAPLEDGDGLGGPFDNSAVDSGAVYVFREGVGGWFQQSYLKASNADESDEYGFAVSVEDQTLVVGAPGEGSIATGVAGDARSNDAPASGAAYAYAFDGFGWSERAYLKPSNTDAADLFGFAVSNSTGGIVVTSLSEASLASGIDGPQFDNSMPDSGAAYTFQPIVSAVSSAATGGAAGATVRAATTSNWGPWQAMGNSGVSIRFCRVSGRYVTWMFRNDRSPTIRSMDFTYRDDSGTHRDLIPFALKPGQAFGGWACYLAVTRGSVAVAITKIVRR